MATKTPNPTPFSLAPLGQAVMESVGEGIVILDPYGRVLYANHRAQSVLAQLGDAAFVRSGALRERLLALGGRVSPLKDGPAELGEAIFLPDGDRVTTLAERERRAIVETLELTQGRLAETARRLGISRTTLWRRLRAYGLRPEGQRGPAARV